MKEDFSSSSNKELESRVKEVSVRSNEISFYVKTNSKKKKKKEKKRNTLKKTL